MTHKHHQAGKPKALVRHLVQCKPTPGGIVFNPFMGSGTTGIAAFKTGRKFIGIERNTEYFDIAVNCIEEAYADEGLVRGAAR